MNLPAWFDGKKINATLFCEAFLSDYPMICMESESCPQRKTSPTMHPASLWKVC